jgi:hypothetical protein
VGGRYVNVNLPTDIEVQMEMAQAGTQAGR